MPLMPRMPNDVSPSWNKNFRASAPGWISGRVHAKISMPRSPAPKPSSLTAKLCSATLSKPRQRPRACRSRHTTSGTRSSFLQQEITQLRKLDLGQAQQRATAAEAAYADAQRHNAAAAAAHGLHPGDDCSVCNRPLPHAWQPPVAESLDAARDAHTAAQASLSEVRNSIHDLATREEITNTQAVELQQGADHSSGDRENSRHATRFAARQRRDRSRHSPLDRGRYCSLSPALSPEHTRSSHRTSRSHNSFVNSTPSLRPTSPTHTTAWRRSAPRTP